MRPILSLLVVVLLLGPIDVRGQEKDAAASTAPTAVATPTPAPPPVPPLAAASAADKGPTDAAVQQPSEPTVVSETDIVPGETTALAPTTESRAGAEPAPSATESTPEVIASVAPAPPATSPQPSSVAPVSPTPVAATDEASRVELLVSHVGMMEQLLVAQHNREVELYRDTIRLVTIFGGAFAGLCMIGLLAAAFLNYRALVAVQNSYVRLQTGGALAAPGGALLAAPGAVPGIDRVRASGQRFQSRMSSLEQRLAEIENLAGREPRGADEGQAAESAASTMADAAAADAGLEPPPMRIVPRAMILVHKAQALSNLGKLNEALATLDEAAALDSAKTEVHLARGQILEKMGRLGDALKAYDTAVGADDHNTSALLLKAGVLNRQERFNEALACYERALEVHRAAV